jgi:hypothetical protein
MCRSLLTHLNVTFYSPNSIIIFMARNSQKFPYVNTNNTRLYMFKTEQVGLAVTLLIRIREVLGSNPGRDISYLHRGFLRTSIRPQPFPSESLPIHPS